MNITTYFCPNTPSFTHAYETIFPILPSPIQLACAKEMEAFLKREKWEPLYKKLMIYFKLAEPSEYESITQKIVNVFGGVFGFCTKVSNREINPDSPLTYEMGKDQLQLYVRFFNKNDPEQQKMTEIFTIGDKGQSIQPMNKEGYLSQLNKEYPEFHHPLIDLIYAGIPSCEPLLYTFSTGLAKLEELVKSGEVVARVARVNKECKPRDIIQLA